MFQTLLTLYQTKKFWTGPNSKLLKTDEKIHLTQKMEMVFERLDNTVGKGENVVYQHFLLFLHVFLKGFFLWVVKTEELCGKWLNSFADNKIFLNGSYFQIKSLYEKDLLVTITKEHFLLFP